MSLPLVSIVTPSYNKHEYVAEAIESVLGQTCTDFEYWVIENSTDQFTRAAIKPYLNDPRLKYVEIEFTANERSAVYIPAYILNQVYPELTGKYIFYLSDDDLLMPTCLQEQVNFLERDVERSVVYHTQKRIAWRNGAWMDRGLNECGSNRGLNTNSPRVDCAIDGGQIMHRADCLKMALTPYFNETLEHASHCDGMFMDRLARYYTFYALPNKAPLSVHRITPKSTWTR